MTKEQIIEEFREKFPHAIRYGYGGNHDENISQEIEAWLAHALTTLETETVKKAVECVPEKEQNQAVSEYYSGWNACRAETLSRLEALISDKKV